MSQIIGLGGGGFTMERSPLLDLYILAASGKETPTVLFLPTASLDNEGYSTFFRNTFSQYPCNPRVLKVCQPVVESFEKEILTADIIYVGGGNSKSMLALWREWGIDKLLKQAYEQGTLLVGVSAGFVCWFEECVTDSLPGRYSVLPCLGLLPGSACPHYDGQGGRPAAYHRLLSAGEISPGYACDDSVGLHFKDGKLLRAIASNGKSFAYQLSLDGEGKVCEDRIQPDVLPFGKHFQELKEKLNAMVMPLRDDADDEEDADEETKTDPEPEIAQ